MGERSVQCGEIRTIMGCGDGPARKGRMEADDLLCSRNARPEKGRGSRQTILLARRTRTIKQCSFDARSEEQSGDSPAVEIDDL